MQPRRLERPRLRAGRLAPVLCLLAAVPTAPAEDVLREYGWDALKAAGRATAGEVVPPDAGAPFHALRVTSDAPRPVTVLALDPPGLLGHGFALAGQVRCDGAPDGTFLEMLVYGPDGGPYFSKAPVGKAAGWRPFRLPYRHVGTGAPKPPERLTLSVVFAGGGRVLLGPIRLLQCAPGEDPFEPGAWWSGETAGLAGGILGGLLGAAGALIGWYASKGLARGFVMGALGAMAAFGLALIAFGLAALAAGQPYAVYYPLLLCGALCGLIGLTLRRSLRKRYEAAEKEARPAPPAPTGDAGSPDSPGPSRARR